MFQISKERLKQFKTIGALVLITIGIIFLAQALINTYLIRNPTLPDESLDPGAARVLSESAPVRLQIPSIGVDASFVELGLAPNNEIEIAVPETYTEVGWYIHGPTPGELGPAVVLGHVNSYRGPAVFFSLGQLNPGDTIEIEREDGSLAVFRVDKLEGYPQSSFPTTLVYGDIEYAGLRLITCSGSYDRELQRYDSNLIVYASLIDETDGETLPE
ncbi:MAG: class F sortase [Candidatus Colwellbacteria bacterium]